MNHFHATTQALPLRVIRFVWNDKDVCWQDAAHYHAAESRTNNHEHVTARSCAGSFRYCHFCCLSSEPALSMSPVTVWHFLGLPASTKGSNLRVINPYFVRAVLRTLNDYFHHDTPTNPARLPALKNNTMRHTIRRCLDAITVQSVVRARSNKPIDSEANGRRNSNSREKEFNYIGQVTTEHIIACDGFSFCYPLNVYPDLLL